MLIISKKKDYYDGVVGTMGIDKTLVYDRELVELEGKNFPVSFTKQRFGLNNSKESQFIKLGDHDIKKECWKEYPNYSLFIIGFCGKLYVGWKLYFEEKSQLGVSNLITNITYDFEFMKTIIQPKGWNTNFEDDYHNVISSDVLQLFRDFNTPVFIYDNDYNRTILPNKNRYYGSSKHNPKFFINPILKDYEFYKIFNTFQAFQEIQMFLGGVLGSGEKEIVQVADKYKIEQFGFDKYSFRKDKEIK